MITKHHSKLGASFRLREGEQIAIKEWKRILKKVNLGFPLFKEPKAPELSEA